LYYNYRVEALEICKDRGKGTMIFGMGRGDFIFGGNGSEKIIVGKWR
jgi:hypothetical protein